MEATIPRTRKTSLAHRLGNIHDALRRGDLELRRAAHDLQALAVLVLSLSDAISDANSVFARMQAGEQASNVLGSILADLG